MSTPSRDLFSHPKADELAKKLDDHLEANGRTYLDLTVRSYPLNGQFTVFIFPVAECTEDDFSSMVDGLFAELLAEVL